MMDEQSWTPEVISDLMHKGIILAGGGALLRGLPERLSEELHLPIHLAEDPLTAVVRGTGAVLENLDHYQDLLIREEDDLPPK
jgi:rod shape-determining protein MreB